MAADEGAEGAGGHEREQVECRSLEGGNENGFYDRGESGMIGTLWWWKFANLDVAGGCGCVARVWRRWTRPKKQGCSGWRAAGPRSRRRTGSRGEDWRNAGRSGPKEVGLSNVRAATWGQKERDDMDYRGRAVRSWLTSTTTVGDDDE